MKFNLDEFAENLTAKDGIYFSASNREISYPEAGNQSCFELEDSSFWFKHRNNCILSAVKKIAADKVFFDIGGGNGFVSSGLEKNGLATVIVEPGIQGCLNAKTRGMTNIICSTLEDAAFKKESIESVGLFDVVEHIEKDVDFLKAIAAYMKKDGHVFITVPAYKWLWSNEDDIAGHYRRYTLRTIEETLNKAGFQMVYKSYIFSILPLPIFFFRSIPSKLGFAPKNIDQEKAKKEHGKKAGFISRMIDKIWNWELKKIQNGKRINFGSSCFVIAKKR